MHCPFCNNPDTQVRDSRIYDDGGAIKRRRHCPSCGERFTTIERIQRRELVVIKRTGERSSFDPEKLMRSINTALRKRKVDQARLDLEFNKLLSELELATDGEVTSQYIGKKVMEMLARLDQVAYIRFASVYEDFNTTEDFRRLLASMD